MAFIKKTWLARLGVGLNRFRMNNSSDVILESNPISVTQQGDQLSADNMNNLETRIDNAFTEMAGNLAPIEVSPATTNHAVGTQIVYNGILYKVISAISTDDNLVVGTNIEPYPVSSAISDISESLTDLETYSSSEEVVVGTWNGVTLYRKVYTGTTQIKEFQETIDINSSKTKTMRFYNYGGNGSFGSDYYTASDDRARCWHLGSKLHFSFGSSYPSTPIQWTVILEYIH